MNALIVGFDNPQNRKVTQLNNQKVKKRVIQQHILKRVQSMK
jgi:hypothetical protein